MTDVLNQLLSYIPGLWRRRWLMVGIAWLICLIGWAAVAFIPDRFSSSTRVYVDTESLLQPLLAGIAIETNPMREVQLMQRTLKSRPNLEKVARMTDLDLAVTTSADQEKLIAELREEIKISSGRGSNLFSINYTHTEPQIAQKVVQALLTIFVESNLGSSRKEMDAARQFIEEQLRKYEEELESADQRLAAFKHQHVGLLPGDLSYYENLNAAQDSLRGLRAELDDTETRTAELKRQLDSVPQYLAVNAAGDGFGEGPPSGLEARILAMESDIDQMRLRYTDRHPDVVAAERLLEELQVEWQEELDATAVAMAELEEDPLAEPEGEKVPNPLYTELKLGFVNAQAQVAMLRQRVARQESKVTELEEQGSRVPEVEIELARLKRDYNVTRGNYQALLSRKESAEISESRDTKGEKVQFRIIEPPQVPTLPTGVKRSVYLTIILVAGLGGAIALGGLIVSLQTTFFGVQRLAQAVAFPVLGSVSMIADTGRQGWRALKLAGFSVACMALLGTYGGLMTVEQNVGLPNMVPAQFKTQVIDVLPPALADQLK